MTEDEIQCSQREAWLDKEVFRNEIKQQQKNNTVEKPKASQTQETDKMCTFGKLYKLYNFCLTPTMSWKQT